MKTYRLTGNRGYATNDEIHQMLYRAANAYHIKSFVITNISDNRENIADYRIEAEYTLFYNWTPWEERVRIRFDFIPDERGFVGMMTIEREPNGGGVESYSVFVDGWIAIDVILAIADPSLPHVNDRGKQCRIPDQYRDAVQEALDMAMAAQEREKAAGATLCVVSAWDYATPDKDTFGAI